METTIKLDKNVKNRLNSLKIHSRESYNDVILRMLNQGFSKKIDKESLIETIEIMSDPHAMRDIAEALTDFEKGNFIELK